ncbi:MAG TPA: DUF6056 family protein [Thermoanaerobaculia bacterium]|jgi:hypothetical protein
MRRGVYLLFCGAVVAALATYAWRGWYARYITDDFCTAGYLRELGFAGAMQFHRDHWSGRFSYFAVKGVLESIGNQTARIVPAALMLLFAAAVAYAVRRLLEPRSRLLVFTVAGTATYALVDASPSLLNIAPSWFWETGSLTYVLPPIVFTCWFALFGWRRSLPATCAASAALMFFAGGLSETSLAAQGAVTGLFLLFALLYRARREAWISAWGLFATLAALAIMGSAAGNIARATTHAPSPRSLGATLLLTLDYAYRFLGWHVFPSGAALLPLLAIGFALGMQVERVSGRAIAILVTTSLAAYLASYVPSAWLLPWTIPERALDVPNYFLALALFCSAVWGGVRMRGKIREAAVTVAIALLAFVPLRSVVAVSTEMIPPAHELARQFDAMDRELRRQQGTDAVLKNGQWALGPGILGADTRFWVNECVCRYYGLRTLRVER